MISKWIYHDSRYQDYIKAQTLEHIPNPGEMKANIQIIGKFQYNEAQAQGFHDPNTVGQIWYNTPPKEIIITYEIDGIKKKATIKEVSEPQWSDITDIDVTEHIMNRFGHGDQYLDGNKELFGGKLDYAAGNLTSNAMHGIFREGDRNEDRDPGRKKKDWQALKEQQKMVQGIDFLRTMHDDRVRRGRGSIKIKETHSGMAPNHHQDSIVQDRECR